MKLFSAVILESNTVGVWGYVKPLRSKGAIKKVERQFNFKFPRAFIDFVSQYNGGRPPKREVLGKSGRSRNIKSLLSFNESDDDNIFSVNKYFSEPGVVAIAIDDTGNYFAIDRQSRVLWYDHEEPDTHEVVFDTVEEFINELTPGDPDFGLITYGNGGYRRSVSIRWWARPMDIDIVVVAYNPQENITRQQRDSYEVYLRSVFRISDRIVPHIVEYLEKNHGRVVESDVMRYITPTAVVFQRDGGWGILFDDSRWDPEHGLAWYTQNGSSFEVGEQGDFL